MLKSRKTFVIVALITAALVGLASTGPGNRYFEIAKNIDIFASLYREVNTYYVDEVNPNTLMREGIDAMLASLDPYTNYISENEIEEYRTANTGEYGGIGVVTTNIDGHTKVIMVNEDYTAHKSGIKTGDEIIEVDGTNIVGMTNEETNVIMKGQAGTTVGLKAIRYGSSDTLSFSIEREKVSIEHVPYYGMLEGDVGYIKLTEFTMHVSRDLREGIADLKEQGANKLVVDLRGNPGGLLIEAVNICNLFIPKGKKVVETRGKISKNNQTYKTAQSPLDTEMPVTVLINRGSASASEIVAGTLQDYDRAVIVGEKSYGKGLVQVPRPLSYNSQLKVTTAKYYTPSGRCIQALDYSNRNPDGSVGKIADSLKSAFKTVAGRTVYDGGGVDPDIIIKDDTLSQVVAMLYLKGHSFDYATEYYYKHAQISPAEEFVISDSEFKDFKNWLDKKNIVYETETEKRLDSLEALAKTESYYGDVKDNLDLLRTTLQVEKKQMLDNNKSQIKRLLEQEICSHYYHERGKVRSSLRSDRQLAAAIEILNDQDKYKRTLQVQ